MIQVEELEGRFADCDWHMPQSDVLHFLESAHAKSAYTGLEAEIASLIEQAQTAVED